MAVIAIVTATALTRAAMYKADAQYLVYDALECFKTSKSEDEFIRAFEFRGNVTKLNGSGELVSPLSGGDVTEDPENGGENAGDSNDETQNADILVFLIKDSGYFVFVSVEYDKLVSINGEGSGIYKRDVFSIIVTNSDSETVASIIDYQKLNINIGG